jgi:hypothetical protein
MLLSTYIQVHEVRAILHYEALIVPSARRFRCRLATNRSEHPPDQIALPLTQHPQASIPEDGFVEECTGNVRHLLGHYYVCTF